MSQQLAWGRMDKQRRFRQAPLDSTYTHLQG